MKTFTNTSTTAKQGNAQISVSKPAKTQVERQAKHPQFNFSEDKMISELDRIANNNSDNTLQRMLNTDGVVGQELSVKQFKSIANPTIQLAGKLKDILNDGNPFSLLAEVEKELQTSEVKAEYRQTILDEAQAFAQQVLEEDESISFFGFYFKLIDHVSGKLGTLDDDSADEEENSFESLGFDADDAPSLYDQSYFDSEDDISESGALLASQHARNKAPLSSFKKVKKGRLGKAQKGGSGEKKSKKEKLRDFFSRAKDEVVVNPLDTGKGKKSYSKKGGILAVHDKLTKIGDATIGNPALTPVESFIQAPVAALAGTNRRAGRTPGTVAKVEEKAGQVLSALGNLIQMVPIFGAVGGPVSGGGTFLQEHALGASKQQASAKAAAATGAGVVAGLIPGYGTYSGMVGLINDCRSVFSSVERHGDPAYAHALLERIEALTEILAEINPENVTQKDIDKINAELEKTYARLAKEMRRREKQDRGEEGMKTGLLEASIYGSLQQDSDEIGDSAEHDFGGFEEEKESSDFQ